MSAPKVYAAINAVAAELAKKGIAKRQTNGQDQYQYRGIDDVYDRLSPLLAAHKLCILPRVLERSSGERTDDKGALLISVSVRTAFDLVSAEDGSVHVIEAYGEALDGGDKATAKAMSAAYKQAVIQCFCIPVSGAEEPDAVSYQPVYNDHAPEPVQGWQQWTSDITEMIRICETGEAIDRVQNSNRHLLKALSRERPGLYRELGKRIGERRRVLTAPAGGKAQQMPAAKLSRSGKRDGAVAQKRSRQKNAEVSVDAPA